MVARVARRVGTSLFCCTLRSFASYFSQHYLLLRTQSVAEEGGYGDARREHRDEGDNEQWRAHRAAGLNMAEYPTSAATQDAVRHPHPAPTERTQRGTRACPNTS